MRRDEGFTLLGLMVVVALINIGFAVAVTSWVTIDKRAREAELIWRGQQYVRALRCHQEQEGGLPEELDDLLESDCIRALYPEPMSSSHEWRVIRESDLESQSAAGRAGTVGSANERLDALDRELSFFDDVRAAGAAGAAGGRGANNESMRTAFDRLRNLTQRLRQDFGSSGDGIVGVASASTDASFRLYEGEATYDKWRFMVR